MVCERKGKLVATCEMQLTPELHLPHAQHLCSSIAVQAHATATASQVSMCAQACRSTLAGLPPHDHSPLTPHPLREGVPALAQLLPPGQVWDFPSLEAAARFAEEQLLAAAVARGLLAPALLTVTLEEVLAAHAGQVRQAGKVEGEGTKEGAWAREKNEEGQVRIRLGSG